MSGFGRNYNRQPLTPEEKTLIRAFVRETHPKAKVICYGGGTVAINSGGANYVVGQAEKILAEIAGRASATTKRPDPMF